MNRGFRVQTLNPFPQHLSFWQKTTDLSRACEKGALLSHAVMSLQSWDLYETLLADRDFRME
jgi:hypothetical protein